MLLPLSAAAVMLFWFLANAHKPYPVVPAAESFEGPVRSPAEIGRFELIGLKLGMSLSDAKNILAKRGFIERRENVVPPKDAENVDFGFVEFQGPRPKQIARDPSSNIAEPSYTNVVTLGFAKTSLGRATMIYSIDYYAPVTSAELRQPEVKRADILLRFGTPTSWKKQKTDNGAIMDSISYAATKELSEETAYDKISSCLIDWKQDWLCMHRDCREVLKKPISPVLRISFMGWEHYRLDDRSFERDILNRNADFRNLDVKGEVCFPGAEE